MCCIQGIIMESFRSHYLYNWVEPCSQIKDIQQCRTEWPFLRHYSDVFLVHYYKLQMAANISVVGKHNFQTWHFRRPTFSSIVFWFGNSKKNISSLAVSSLALIQKYVYSTHSWHEYQNNFSPLCCHKCLKPDEENVTSVETNRKPPTFF